MKHELCVNRQWTCNYRQTMYSIKHGLWTGSGHAISFPNKYQSMYLTGAGVRCATATGPVFFNRFLLGSTRCLSLQRDTPENSGVSGELSFPPSKSIGKRRCFFGSVWVTAGSVEASVLAAARFCCWADFLLCCERLAPAAMGGAGGGAGSGAGTFARASSMLPMKQRTLKHLCTGCLHTTVTQK